MADQYIAKYGIDANGNTVWFADEQARQDIAALKDLPAGSRIVSAVELKPEELPEGVWKLEGHHNFVGDYVYTRVE